MGNVATTSTTTQQLTRDALVKFLKNSKIQHIDEFQVDLFYEACKYYGLNPFLREIYAIPSNNGFYFHVNYTTLLRLALQSNDYEGFEYQYGNDDYGFYCDVMVYRRDKKPFRHRCYAAEFIRDNNNKNDSHNRMPRFMLMKIAISQALRIVFPDMFKITIYINEEVDLIDNNNNNNNRIHSNNNIAVNDKIMLLALTVQLKNNDLTKKVANILSDDEREFFKRNRSGIINMLNSYKFSFDDEKLTINELVNELLDLDPTLTDDSDSGIMAIHSALSGKDIVLSDIMAYLVDYLSCIESIKQHYNL